MVVSKYVKIYHKRNILVAFGCATIVFVPLFSVSLFYDIIKEDTLISFIPFVIAVVCVVTASLYTVRFKKMIKTQERLYKVKFLDTDVEHLETTLYLSKEWLIWAGSCAIYKEHIMSVKFA